MKLVDSLTKVVSDEEWTRRFSRDPRCAMRRADLSADAMKAIRSGDPRYVGYVICVKEMPRDGKLDPVD